MVASTGLDGLVWALMPRLNLLKIQAALMRTNGCKVAYNVCKTFMRRYDPGPRLQFPLELSQECRRFCNTVPAAGTASGPPAAYRKVAHAPPLARERFHHRIDGSAAADEGHRGGHQGNELDIGVERKPGHVQYRFGDVTQVN